MIAIFPFPLVRVVRLERTISTSQMWRGTNSAIPGYSVFCHDSREEKEKQDFPVCGHSCGQSELQGGIPSKANPASATVQIPSGVATGQRWIGGLSSQTRRDTTFATPGYSLYFPVGEKGPEVIPPTLLFYRFGLQSQGVFSSVCRLSLTPASATAKVNQKMHMTRG